MKIEKKYLMMIPVFWVLIVNAILIYSPHFNYRYPIHVDEWDHLSLALNIIDNKAIQGNHPFFEGKHNLILKKGFMRF